MGYYVEMGRKPGRDPWNRAEIHHVLVDFGMELNDEPGFPPYSGRGLTATIIDEPGPH